MLLIKVTDGSGVSRMWIDSDSGLSLETLKSVVPDATNLVNPAYEGEKVFLSISNGKIFNPDGWDSNIVYIVHYGSRPLTQDKQFYVARSDQCQSRMPLDEYDYDKQHFSQFLCYTKILMKDGDKNIVEVNGLKTSCASFRTSMFPRRHFIISTRHGAHKDLEEGDRINLYSHDHQQFTATVIFYKDEQDFVLMEVSGKVPDNLPQAGPVIAGHNYIMLGFADLKQHLNGEEMKECFTSGIFMSCQPNQCGHVCGSSSGVSGFSSGPVFDLINRNLVGICISTDDLEDRETSLSKFASDMINYCKETTIVRILPIWAVIYEFYNESKK